MRDSRPSGMRDSHPGVMRDSRPGGMRDSRSGGMRDSRPGGMRDSRSGESFKRALATLKRRVRVGERVLSRMPWKRHWENGHLRMAQWLRGQSTPREKSKLKGVCWSPMTISLRRNWVEFKTEMQSRIDDFKETLQSYGEDIDILKKAVLQGSASSPEAPSKV
ncbi:hypothetical protein CK203_054710 [Vitis vinifera]|uniref:Uncharacterized protein n=1 Tax=Vitis vinifera TaxID=29760 RepID=A0A438H1W9_VITVI|nr:hypothetical protein CK203_054710 [Vitis vinifera]